MFIEISVYSHIFLYTPYTFVHILKHIYIYVYTRVILCISMHRVKWNIVRCFWVKWSRAWTVISNSSWFLTRVPSCRLAVPNSILTLRSQGHMFELWVWTWAPWNLFWEVDQHMNPNSAKPYLPFGCICQEITRHVKACIQQQSTKMRILRPHLQWRKAVFLQQLSQFSRSPTSWIGTTLPSMLSALGFALGLFRHMWPLLRSNMGSIIAKQEHGQAACGSLEGNPPPGEPSLAAWWPALLFAAN